MIDARRLGRRRVRPGHTSAASGGTCPLRAGYCSGGGTAVNDAFTPGAAAEHGQLVWHRPCSLPVMRGGGRGVWRRREPEQRSGGGHKRAMPIAAEGATISPPPGPGTDTRGCRPGGRGACRSRPPPRPPAPTTPRTRPAPPCADRRMLRPIGSKSISSRDTISSGSPLQQWIWRVRLQDIPPWMAPGALNMNVPGPAMMRPALL